MPRRRGASVPDSLTYQQTATRAFEENYWKTIASLAEGTFLNKNNADCVDDEITRKTAPLSPAATRYSRRLSAWVLQRANWRSSHDRQGTGGRDTVSMANRPRLLMDGRLAQKSGSPLPQYAHHDSGTGSEPGRGHVRPLRYRIHD